MMKERRFIDIGREAKERTELRQQAKANKKTGTAFQDVEAMPVWRRSVPVAGSDHW
jgi:hypothetical protein